ncbi:Flp pilus assembly protein CpaB [Mesorhizobium sp.]|uniref:Flp pilus assembly protein CpaB n=1 Tax=Mesorhizobium sp. TaxID=1871066 RepID=UPI000FE91FC4|nr:Flp pilus assembly protein CpaB [Mesorhizobium sp.]RWK41384.1 MAG: Flp pilus assembly protein CpaB [Mesorhizobium sp.]RWK68491.1 MAG: Flp pilus assembly protein CpaB [Mesorhizobium sp.]RWK71701.1 MAG: Flp pilus assembly protein CpaB [Mesorhizobium sp.]RWK74625.1 MAG: Flp pilus assembly protein CpaB [Mesorhizobium sp.]RWL03614.1 MAG: Flp pilus assembly protein CpaB [Mesorhizobium sp.]
MRANTIIMIVLAAVFGVLAVVLANIWLASQRSAMAKTGEVERDTVVVAAVALKFGDTLTADKLREIAWPAGAVPAGAFKTTKEALAGDGTKQALQAIGTNEPLLATKITGPGQRATLSAVLGEGMKAVSIRVNDVLGVAGFVFPGDRVDVLLTRTTRSGADKSFVDVLLQSMKVLAVDQVADESKDSPTVVKSVTLEASTRDAQKLTLAAGAGQLSLALRQAAASEGETTERVTLSDLTGDTPADVAARQAELAKQAAADAEAAAERKRADDKINGLTQAVERVGSRLDLLSNAKPAPAVASAPQMQEVVKEVIKYVQPEPPARATIGVFRGVKLQSYDVPRQK